MPNIIYPSGVISSRSSLIKALGLQKEGEVQPKASNGVRRRAIFEAVRLELMRRDGVFQVVEGS